MRELSIDLETFSEVNLKTHGLYKYVEDASFEILLFAYSLDDAPVEVIDIASGEEVPAEIIALLLDSTILKTAYNAMFERLCINRWFKLNVDVRQWECTLVRAGMIGLPMNLEGVGLALKLDTQKSLVGKRLIRLFCIPCKPTKANGMRTRNTCEHFPEQWAEFKDYCEIDVYTEKALRKRIAHFEIPAKEKELYYLDQKINDYGVLVDQQLVDKAIAHNVDFTTKLLAEARELTGLENPKSVKQLLSWLQLEIDETITTLRAKAVHKLLQGKTSAIVRRVLEIRQQISKTSIKKYDSIKRYLGVDNRIRGTLQFYGANRTGRFAGRGPQLHNITQNHLDDLALARDVCRNQQIDDLEFLFGDISGVLSQLIRTSLIAPLGKKLAILDYSAIEARIIAWLANEKWRLDVFRTHGKIYEASGAAMFNVPIASVIKGSVLRQKAKISELALGYQGSIGALKTMGAEEMGLKEDELPDLVYRWRDANINIVNFWYAVQDAAIRCVRDKETVILDKLTFYMDKGIFFIKLPSGRSLAYLKPILGKNKNGYDSLSYHGVNQKTKQWEVIPTYGGKLCENITQGIARDCLCEGLLRIDAINLLCVLHVHDEYLIEVNESFNDMQYLEYILKAPMPWALDLPLDCEGYFSPFYKKD